MPKFSYKAAGQGGKVVQGIMEAQEGAAVVARIQEMGLIPMTVSPVKAGGRAIGISLSQGLRSVFARISGKDVLLFTQDLSALLGAGLPVDRALSILIETSQKQRFKDVVRDILKSVQGGAYLSDALAKHPRIFSTFYVNMVKAGEAGGVLEAVLDRLALFLENIQELKDYIKSSMVYPLFLVTVGGISIIILLTYVIPKFSIIFADMGGNIPLTTKILLGISDFARLYWPFFAGAIGLSIFLLRRYLKSPSGRLRFDTFLMDMPIGGEIVRKIEAARFARTLGTLTKSGVPILQAITLVKEILGNRVVANAMNRVHERVKEGERLSRPLADTGIFPALAVQMVTVGEETGRLDDMLIKIAENYEKAVRDMVKRFVSLLEPAMILLMGIMVGFIVISMLMAIFSINEMPF
jgi:general secretion pathway protein F